ncbi:MAG: glycosyltransferase [Gammaproteobacteria bacterium]|nr:glycosyltransferase [Gammaproteobacteria bacterium]MBU1444398.1 glycosyltransferase [Gammaproteobacteria bacterium]MBU2285571.1 glycosyltransferase [Gammaproteobacteria bacterium]MBU2409813.1 glycosyltransferase [Gammaproteobacteria bacterium]
MTMTPPSPAAVTVSIVSHGQLDLVRPLLDQLDRFCGPTIAKVVLTVNIPEPDVLGTSPRGFEVVRIANARPKGFGANHNQAFERCDTPWFLVLNPDIRLDADILTPLIDQAAEKSGLLAPRILEPGKSAPEQHRRIITPLEIVSRKRPDYARPTEPAWIPGLFMLFRSTAFGRIHGFDERFFMYGEDFDICARLRLDGWRLQIAEDLRARHDAQRASHRSRRHLYWHLTSLLRVWTSRAFWRYRGLEVRSR